MNPMLARLGDILAVLAGLGVILGMAAAFAVILIFPSLPSLDPLTNYRPRIPLRIYTADEVLIGFNVRKYGGKLLIKPSKPAVKRFLEDLRGLKPIKPPRRQS